jgi:hypothetical protein
MPHVVNRGYHPQVVRWRIGVGIVVAIGCGDAAGRGVPFTTVSGSASVGTGSATDESEEASSASASEASSAEATGSSSGSMPTEGSAEAGSGAPLPEPCEPIPGAAFGQLPTVGPVTDTPAPEHGDLNLELRSWEPTGGTLGFVQIDGPTDTLAPRLNSIFTDDRIPDFVANYAVHHWDWDCNCQGDLITDWEVTLAGFGTSPGEVLELPRSGYDIGNGLDARVLYASDASITLKYSGEDNVVSGYTVHVAGLCVEPSLRQLYDELDAGGRVELPALAADQPLGRARGSEIQVAIRDTGAFMDPRSDKDWWE